MSIIEVSVAYQLEGVKEKKRKEQMYNIVTKIPVEIQDVEKKNANLVATLFSHGMGQVFLTPYYEYNGDIYKPLLNKNNINRSAKYDNYLTDLIRKTMDRCNSEHLFEWDCLYTRKGIMVDNYSKIDNKTNLFTIGIDEDCEIVELEEIKRCNRDNLKFKTKYANNYANNIIAIDGELFYKNHGPIFDKRLTNILDIDDKNIDYLDNNRYFPTYSSNLLYLFGMSGLFFPEQGKNKEHALEYMRQEVEGVDLQFPKIGGIIFDYQKLFQSTKHLFGRVLFENTLGEQAQRRLRSTHYGKERPETEMNIFLQYLEDTIPSSSEWINKYKQCIESNYDFYQVVDTLKSVNDFMNLHRNKISQPIYLANVQKYCENPSTDLKQVSVKRIISPASIVLNQAKQIYSELSQNYDNIFKYGIETPDTIISKYFSFHQDNTDIVNSNINSSQYRL
jgi:hypothetical protein